MIRGKTDTGLGEENTMYYALTAGLRAVLERRWSGWMLNPQLSRGARLGSGLAVV